MSEAHRYCVVKMLSEDGNCISYDPKGPEVVLATSFDRVTAERDALQHRLTAADERADSFDRLYTSSLDERDQLQQRADVLEGLLLQTNELLYAIQGDPGAVPSSSIDSMRGRVFEALKRDRSTSVLQPQNL